MISGYFLFFFSGTKLKSTNTYIDGKRKKYISFRMVLTLITNFYLKANYAIETINVYFNVYFNVQINVNLIQLQKNYINSGDKIVD